MMNVSKELVEEMIDYIEKSELAIEYEWGSCRTLKELICNNSMPKFYDDLLSIRDVETGKLL